jgi:uncharacterized 2Fe-2S/4Fe-4S cluster protein (DUF4445 family)
MPIVTFVNEFRHVEVPSGMNLRTVARENGIVIDRQHFLGLSCKNRGLCGQCQVWIKEKALGATSPRTWKETGLFFRRFKGWRRLACQVKVLGDVEVWTTPGGPDRMAARPIDAPPTPSAHAKPAEPPKEPKDAKEPATGEPAAT